jgi:hypothetical protein
VVEGQALGKWENSKHMHVWASSQLLQTLTAAPIRHITNSLRK